MSEPPYVTAALFCERVIEGKDGVLSAIRFIERAQVEFGSDDPDVVEVLNRKKVAPALQVTCLVGIRAGSLSGKFTLHVDGQKPSGKRTRLQTFPVELNGGDSGANFVLNIAIAVDEEGIYWFDVIFEERVLTRVPLTIARAHRPDVKRDAEVSK